MECRGVRLRPPAAEVAGMEARGLFDNRWIPLPARRGSDESDRGAFERPPSLRGDRAAAGLFIQISPRASAARNVRCTNAFRAGRLSSRCQAKCSKSSP